MKKKQRVLSLLLSLVMVFSLLPAVSLTAMAADDAMAGSGTAADPYVIENVEDLAAINNNLSAHYILKNDIAPESWTTAIGIDDSNGRFTGTLDGNGYTITLPEGTTVSLFGGLKGTIENLRLVAEKMNLTGDYQGILVGKLNGIVKNCAIIGSLESDGKGKEIGGLTGRTNDRACIVSNTYTAVSIVNTAENASVGAVAGYALYSSNVNALYNSDLYEKGTAKTGIGTFTFTGMTTAELQAAAETLNANRDGLLSWGNAENGYPVFAEHQDIQTGSVSITGTLKDGETLTAEDTFTSQKDRTYAWYRVNGTGAETAIEGADQKEYTLTAEDVGFRIKVVAAVPGAVGGNPTAVTDSTVAASQTVTVTFDVTPADAAIAVKNSADTVIASGTTVQLPAGGTFRYVAGRNGYEAAGTPFTTGTEDQTVKITLTEKTLSGWSSEETNNMQIGDLADLPNFPTSADTAVVKWAVPTGTSYWGVEHTNAVFAGGNLYVAGHTYSDTESTICLKKVDPETGEVLAKTPLSNKTGYNYFLTTAEDMIFIMEDGKVEAFNTDLEKLWVSDTIAPGQGLCPINYADGFVYGGTCRSDGAGFFCLSAIDGSLMWFNKAELKDGADQGSYWAGGCVVGDWVVYGTDGGRLYVADKLTGAIQTRVDVLSNQGGHIRSSIAYADGSIYFTTTKGYLCKAAFDAETGTVSGLTTTLIGITEDAGEIGNTTTATPVIYNGRVYVGSNQYFGVFSAADLTCIYRTAQSHGTLRDLRLVADKTTGDAYLFTSYYKEPGSVVMYVDKAGQTASTSEMDFAAVQPADLSQFCASMPIFGPDGTIYASNDKGYLIAYSKLSTYLTGIQSNIGQLKKDFAAGDLEPVLLVPAGTEEVTLTLTASEGSTIQVNGAAYTEPLTVSLADGPAVLTIVTAKGDASQTYTLTVRPIHSDAGISVVTNTSDDINSWSNGEQQTYGDTDDVYVLTGASSWGSFGTRIWLTAKDSTSVLSAPEMLQGSLTYTKPTESNVYTGTSLTYTDRLFATTGSVLPAVARTTVTAEDGTAKTYYLVLMADKTYDGTTAYALDLSLSKTELSFSEAGASETLTADLRYIGNEEPQITWESSNSAVASVDENGVVTAVGSGTAVITASAAGLTASCTVNCASNSGEATVYMTYSGSDGKFVTGSDAASTVLWNVPVTVSDMNLDGKVTVDDAFAAFHNAYCTAGTAGYQSAGGYINRFWGVDTYSISYTLNNKDPQSTAAEIKSGDRINAYLYQDTTSYADLYTYFDAVTAAATAGESKTFTVHGLAVMSNSAEAVPAGAVVTVYDSEGKAVSGLTATVGADGTFRLTFPAKGTYTVEVSGESTYTASDWNGNPVTHENAPLVPSRCTVTVTDKSGSGGSVSSEISVKFRLIGSTLSKNGVDIENGVDDAQYVTWIPTKRYQVESGSTVYDLMTQVLGANGLDYTIKGGTWIHSITAPDAAGGYDLAEMDNGSYSGWMYSVNGIHVQKTVDEQKLKNGDSVIVHYINDYRYEDSQWAGGSEGDKTYWDRWLKAADVKPGSTSGGTVTDPEETTGETVKSFTDVPANAWYKAAADRMAKLGVVKGTTETTFSPDRTVSRAMFVTMVGRLYELDGKTAQAKKAAAFTDVPDGQYYSGYVAWGAENGVVQGYLDGRFAPDAVVNREQMAVFLYRYAKLTGRDVTAQADLTKFADGAQVSAYAREAMSWAVAAGLMQGTADNRLMPQGSATRSQLVVLLDRFLGPESK